MAVGQMFENIEQFIFSFLFYHFVVSNNSIIFRSKKEHIFNMKKAHTV